MARCGGNRLGWQQQSPAGIRRTNASRKEFQVALDEETAALLDAVGRSLPRETFQLPVPELRAMLSGPHQGDPVAVARVRDLKIDGPGGPLPLRVYHPGGDEPPPVLVWFHGGGFVLGGIDHSDHVCRELAGRAGVVVVAVEFRLAPEDPHPAALEDCAAAVLWVAANASDLAGDRSRIAVGGESTGATLAAAVSQLLRDRGGFLPALQVMAYPVVRLRASNPEYADLPMMPIEAAERFWGLYCPEDRWDEPYAEPAGTDDLSGLPPAVLLSAEADLGRDDAEEYALRLARAGVRTTLRRVPSSVHGFLGMTGALASAREGMRELVAALRAEL
jgi:acetyl esterase